MRCVPKSGSSEPEGQPPSGNLRSGACRKAEAVSPKANPPSGNLRNGAYRKAEAVSPKANPPSGNLRNGRRKNELAQRPPRIGACRKAEAMSPKTNPPRATPKRKAEEPTRPAATPNRCMPKSGSSEPEGQPAQRKPESKRQPRAAKTTQDERSPSAGRSRETRGRRSSADTPTNTIEKRDCDTLRPSEAS